MMPRNPMMMQIRPHGLGSSMKGRMKRGSQVKNSPTAERVKNQLMMQRQSIVYFDWSKHLTAL
jgi:alpha-acetolactate decarboxylase